MHAAASSIAPVRLFFASRDALLLHFSIFLKSTLIGPSTQAYLFEHFFHSGQCEALICGYSVHCHLKFARLLLQFNAARSLQVYSKGNSSSRWNGIYYADCAIGKGPTFHLFISPFRNFKSADLIISIGGSWLSQIFRALAP